MVIWDFQIPALCFNSYFTRCPNSVFGFYWGHAAQRWCGFWQHRPLLLLMFCHLNITGSHPGFAGKTQARKSRTSNRKTQTSAENMSWDAGDIPWIMKESQYQIWGTPSSIGVTAAVKGMISRCCSASNGLLLLQTPKTQGCLFMDLWLMSH